MMAERRMFTQKIVDSDAFLDMPLTTQALYFHLNMRADDDGFVNNPKKIQRMIGASEDDLKLLVAKRFILAFENGVIVIKHWRMHNLLRKDRYNPTQYQEQMSEIELKDNGAYTEKDLKPLEIVDSESLATKWQPSGNQMATQDSIGKDSIGKDSTSNNMDVADTNAGNITKPPKTSKKKYGEFKHVLLNDSEYTKLSTDFGDDVRDMAIKFLDEYIEEKGYKSKSHYLAIRRWVINAVENQASKHQKNTNNSAYGKKSVAEQLDESYKMMANWAASSGDND